MDVGAGANGFEQIDRKGDGSGCDGGRKADDERYPAREEGQRFAESLAQIDVFPARTRIACPQLTVAQGAAQGESPPTNQPNSNADELPTSWRMKPDVVKMPVPTMLATTMAMAENRPISLFS